MRDMSRITVRPAPDDDRPRWEGPWPQTWGQVYAVIMGLLAGFLALAFLLDWLRGVI